LLLPVGSLAETRVLAGSVRLVALGACGVAILEAVDGVLAAAIGIVDIVAAGMGFDAGVLDAKESADVMFWGVMDGMFTFTFMLTFDIHDDDDEGDGEDVDIDIGVDWSCCSLDIAGRCGVVAGLLACGVAIVVVVAASGL